ncbi:MAG: superoxide dismutase [Fe] [Candidatus Omnitrophica bacterium]|nr:superoxide dismutase [Fe] [Candidatus Omnitrophota bacterium]
MSFTLPKLPYELDALSPRISKETLEYHYGKHHNAYVTKLNSLIEGKPEAGKSLEDLIRTSSGPVFNNAAQVWNHTFYWNCLSARGGGEPKGALAETIKKGFGSFESFKAKFSEAAVNLFGSGWAWLVKGKDGGVQIVQGKNAENPITQNQTPILTCDVWEHAYYIDYRNARPKYVETFWNLVNWEFVESQLQGVNKAVKS